MSGPHRRYFLALVVFFIFFILSFFIASSAQQLHAQEVPYGTNDAAGHYVQLPDARIYYESYGHTGRPLVMLHGGLYGYIDEFGDLIHELSKKHTVIAIATRGYGRSERGTLPLSHRQFAQDAAMVLQKVLPKGETADLIGFSEGAISAYILASKHPELIHRVIAIGGPLGRPEKDSGPPITPEIMQKQVPGLVAARKKQMPHPEQWEQLIRDLAQMYRGPVVFVKEEEVHSIQAPTLILAGEGDPTGPERFVAIYRMLPKGQLAIIPGCGHVVFTCKVDVTLTLISDFLQSI